MNSVKSNLDYKWVMISLAFIISFLLHLLFFGTAPMVDEIMREMELSHAQFGIIFSAAMASLLIFRIPWGILGDKLGYLKVLRISLPLISLSAIIRGFAGNYLILLSSQFLLGAGLASIMPCFPLLIKEWFSENSGLATGIYVSGFALGNGTALGVTPLLLDVMVWRKILILFGTISLVVTALWWVLGRSEENVSHDFNYKNFTELLTNGKVIILTLFLIAAMGCYDTLATYMPRILELKSLGKSPSLLLSLGFFLSGPFAGVISDRIRDENLLIGIMGSLSAFFIVGINYVPTTLLWTFLLLAGFFLMGTLTLTLKIPAIDPDLKDSGGEVTGIISSISNIGPLAIPVAFGYLIDVTGTYTISIFMVAGIALSIFSLGSQPLR